MKKRKNPKDWNYRWFEIERKLNEKLNSTHCFSQCTNSANRINFKTFNVQNYFLNYPKKIFLAKMKMCILNIS